MPGLERSPRRCPGTECVLWAIDLTADTSGPCHKERIVLRDSVVAYVSQAVHFHGQFLDMRAVRVSPHVVMALTLGTPSCDDAAKMPV